MYLRESTELENNIQWASYLHDYMKDSVRLYHMHLKDIGQGGDFITAPEISPLFGEAVGAWCVQKWKYLGKPKFRLIELGPGRGTMMIDILRATKNVTRFHDSIEEVSLVEIGPYLQLLQEKRFNELKDELSPLRRAKWYRDVRLLPHSNMIVVSNEFFDTFPIDAYIKLDYKSDYWGRAIVMYKDGKYELGALKDNYDIHPKALADFLGLERIPRVSTNTVIERAPGIEAFAEALIKRMPVGASAMLAIDYGYVKPPKKLTLQAFRKHQAVNPFTEPGTADLTALVNFSKLAMPFKLAGMDVDLIHQADFLKKYGIENGAKELVKNGANPEAVLSQVERLTNKEMMGVTFKAFEVMNFSYARLKNT
jgi:NADH dehydrogenase [ubiquinone] 1 alpha subcomplex assembly factor 7